MMVHRLLTKYLDQGGRTVSEQKYEALCEHSSSMEQIASNAERASIKYKQEEFMTERLGQTFDGVISGVIYLHSGPEGSKVEMVTKHPQVCITFCEGHELVYMHRQVACSYSMKSRSVICRGKVHFVEDMEEKRRVLDMLMKQYTENECKYSEPAVRNVKIWEVKVEKISCRSFGLRPSEL